MQLCRAANCPSVPPWVCNVLCPNRLVSLQQFAPSDLIMDWEKSRSWCFLMGNCPNSVCFIKKIAAISLKKAAWPWLCAVLGLPWLHTPGWQRNCTHKNKWKMGLLHPLTTGTTIESWWDPELALTELKPFGPRCREITASGQKLGNPVAMAVRMSKRGARQLSTVHWQLLFLGFWLIVLIKVMSDCSSYYLSPKLHGSFVGQWKSGGSAVKHSIFCLLPFLYVPTTITKHLLMDWFLPNAFSLV